MPISIGIDALSLYTPSFFLPLRTLAEARGIDPDKYTIGLGQEEMSILPPDEDTVSMGANAAAQIISKKEKEAIKLVLFATETGVDQSKAASLWVHHLLQLPKDCRVIEIKQACYSATCGLKLAKSYVQEHPDHKVLIIASDNARYGFHTPGEPTQGCAAVAFIVSANPKILSIEPHEGYFSEHIMDFWRPNYMTEALVDGKFSTRSYLQSLLQTWDSYVQKSGRSYSMHDRFCYHLPFTKMGEKAHEKIIKSLPQNERELAMSRTETLSPSLIYSKKVGNGYTASLYMSLISLLEHEEEDLTQKRIGFFSYGSGCTSEFFSGIVQPTYMESSIINKKRHCEMIDARKELSCAEYEEFFVYQIPKDGGLYETPNLSNNRFRFKGISRHERIYEFSLK
ncbi:MAG: hydroxymethylglutaryl-CoA synthase [Chlamydia sp.]